LISSSKEPTRFSFAKRFGLCAFISYSFCQPQKRQFKSCAKHRVSRDVNFVSVRE
jgi:hypothetical protein